MPPILRIILSIAVPLLIIYMGFQIHWLAGTLLIVAILGYGFYSSRSLIYAQRGNMAFVKGDETKALELLEKAHRVRNANPQHMVGYAYLLMRAGRVDQAERVLHEVLKKPSSEQVQLQAKVNLATAYWQQGQKDEGIQLLEELASTRRNTQLYGNLGYFRMLRGDDPEEVLSFNLEAYEFNDSDLTILDNLAQNYYMLGRLEEAREMFQKVMAQTPKYADPYYYYALTLKELGQREEACEQINAAKDKKTAMITKLTNTDIDILAQELGC